MKRWLSWILAGVVTMASASMSVSAPSAEVVISEILAANITGLRDEDGDSSDWIELYNGGPAAVSLDGWFLTDDPGVLTQWRFPAVTLASGDYLVVFASGKDRVAADAPLHTNFRLAREGEYLGLVDAGLNVVSDFGPAFPPQRADISYGRDAVYQAQPRYYATPTPGAANAEGRTVVAPVVEFSVLSRTFAQPFALTLSTPQPDAEIRYEIVHNAATVSNAPSPASPLYSGPIQITNSMMVRAQAFVVGGLPGRLRSESYVRLETDVLGFSSDLPVVILHTFGSPAYPSGYATSNHTPAFLAVYEPTGGRTSLTNPPATTTRVGINVHGGSTSGFAKSSFNLETWDESNEDKDIALLGMPPESDWLFHAPNGFTPTLLNHSFINELSRQAGRYAPRTRLVELFVSTNAAGSGALGVAQYNGVYAVMEKIKRSPARVAVDRLDLEDTNAPAISGGYLMKTERTEVHERVTPIPTVGSVPGNAVIFQHPESDELVRPEREAQRRYITRYLLDTATNLASAGFAHPTAGYARYLNPGSWVDHHIINVLAMNVDAFRLGGFWSKPRDQVNERGETVIPGRLEAGPVYDFDRALGSKDGRDFNPRVWRSAVGDLGTDFFHFWWYDRLFRDPDFWQRWIDRWQEQRQTVFSLANMTRLIDSLRDAVREAQPRELARWGSLTGPRTGRVASGEFSYDFGTGSYETEISFLKHWLSNRVDFIDTNFVARPRLNVSGDATSGYALRLDPGGPGAPGAVIYYTLDGNDPRQPGGALTPGARVYSGPFAVTANARVVARAYNSNHRVLTGPNAPPLSSSWSGSVSQTLVVDPPPLRITELMYHPHGDPGRPLEFEYIELRNTGAALNLEGFRLRGAVEFSFPSLLLGPGQYVVVAGDRAGFTARYGDRVLVAGQYQRAMGNERGRLTLEGPLGEAIHDFDYSNQWHPATAGLGFSLVIQNELLPLREPSGGGTVDTWSQAMNWRASTAIGGSPGVADPTPPEIARVIVNEVLPRPGPGQAAFVELFNRGAFDAQVGGWYLSDTFGWPKKYRIPDGTVLPAGGYLVIEESQLNPGLGSADGFAFRAVGGEVFLFSADAAGSLSGYTHGVAFGPSRSGVSIGRHATASAGDQYVAQQLATPRAANAGPRVGPIVISEVFYHPVGFFGPGGPYDNTDDEFIEVKNISANPVALFEPGQPINAWQIRGDTSFVFPPGITMPANGYALITRFDPVRDPDRLTAFRLKYGMADDVPVFGPLKGSLANTGALVELAAPERIVYAPTRSELAYVQIDHVRYGPAQPWPAAADGIGPSLNRIAETGFGNDPANWSAAAPGPGKAFIRTGELPVIAEQPQSQTGIAYQTVSFGVVAGGSEPLTYQWRFNGVPIAGATGDTLRLSVVQPEQAGSYDVVVMSSSGAVTSQSAQLSLRIPLRFTFEPSSQTLRPGQSATFGVAVESLAPPVSYQWFHDNQPIDGATGSNFAVVSVTAAERGDYFCAVTDGVSTSNSATARLTVLIAPNIVQSPVSQSAPPGGTVVFSVQVTDTATRPIGYRWRRNGATISVQSLDSTVSHLIVPNPGTNSPTTYTVVVTNAAFSAPGFISSEAVLTILADNDGDGLPDVFETSHGLDPFNPADSGLDSDGDTMSNGDEYTAGTNPRDTLSYLKTERISRTDVVRLEFTAVANKTYTVQGSDVLGGPWSTVAQVVAQPATRTVVAVDERPGARRFYRLVTPAQPASR